MSHSSKKRAQPVHVSPPSVTPSRAKSVISRDFFQRTARNARAWWTLKHPVLKFVICFALLLGIFYALTLTSLFKKHFFPDYLHWNALAAHRILIWLGQTAIVEGRSILGAGYKLDINRGCDAVEPTFLLLAAMLAFPAPLKHKIPGALIGVILLGLANLVRVVSLFFIGKYWPRLFDLMHIEIWQSLFILFALVFWGLWIQWSFRQVSKPIACTLAKPSSVS